jgi:regulatory protein
MGPKKYIGIAEARSKAEKYCAYQERCHQEVESKLRGFQLKEPEISDILVHLVHKGFLNEERFALAYAGGKYRVLGWGRKKIIYQLKAKGINEKLIDKALKVIPENDYTHTIQELIQKKDRQLKETDKLQRIAKMSRYLNQKGFEPDLIFSGVKKYYG